MLRLYLSTYFQHLVVKLGQSQKAFSASSNLQHFSAEHQESELCKGILD